MQGWELGDDQIGNSCQDLMALEDATPGRRERSDPEESTPGVRDLPAVTLGNLHSAPLRVQLNNVSPCGWLMQRVCATCHGDDSSTGIWVTWRVFKGSTPWMQSISRAVAFLM